MIAYASVGVALMIVFGGALLAVLSRRNGVRNAGLVAAACGVVLLAGELGAVLWVNVPKLWGYTTNKHYEYEDGLLGQRDPTLGYGPIPDNSVLESLYYDDIAVFTGTRYTFDEKGRRVVPLDNRAPRHALFFGGSYTFGEGLPNDATLSARFQAYAEGNYQAYNYAYKGYGPNQMLCQLQDDAKFDDIAQDTGIAVYGFIRNHIWRAAGAPWQLSVVKNIPFFRLGPDGTLDGPLTYSELPSMRRRMAAYTFVQHYSPLGRLLFARKFMRAVPDEEAIRIAAAVVVASAERYKERFDGTFYTVLWPRRRLPEAQERLFIDLLRDGGVQVIQPPPLPNPAEAMMHPIDEHPSAKEVDWIARHVYESITSESHEIESPSPKD